MDVLVLETVHKDYLALAGRPPASFHFVNRSVMARLQGPPLLVRIS